MSFRRALKDLGPSKDIVVWTPREIAEWQNVPSAFITIALREGVVLYVKITAIWRAVGWPKPKAICLRPVGCLAAKGRMFSKSFEPQWGNKSHAFLLAP